MTVLIPVGTTAATSTQTFTPGADPISLYIVPAAGVDQTTSSNVIFIERQTSVGWQRVLTLTGEGDGDGVIFLAKGTFRGRRPLQGDACGLEFIGTATLA